MQQPTIVTDLTAIASHAAISTEENEYFRMFLSQQYAPDVDTVVYELNEQVSQIIDCTACGNCCRSFMINVSEEEAVRLSSQLKMNLSEVKSNYLEESSQGNLVIKSIPCSFLTGNKCSIYTYRFDGCREFPHLHRANFTGRLFGILMYYGTCPIIFNVVEALKLRTGFKQ